MKKISICPRSILFLLFVLLGNVSISYAQEFQLVSPNSHYEMNITNDNSIHFEIKKDNRVLLPRVNLSMILKDKDIFGRDIKVKEVKTSTHHAILKPIVKIKNRSIVNSYNQLILNYNQNYKIVFRAYNDAIAYRFETNFNDSIVVQNEGCDIQLVDSTKGWFASTKSWVNDYQNLYEYKSVNTIAENKYLQLPILIDLNKNEKMLITESDLQDYPGLYFEVQKGSTLSSVFPPKAKTTKKVRRKILPDQTFNYIAKTNGSRTFPWRIFAFSKSDKELLNNEIVYKLASPNKVKYADWIHPGQVSWDWWNHRNITGVDFKVGVNTKTYKYFIDFAARNDIPYIQIDDGWFTSGDITKQNPDIDIKELIQYGKKRGVGIMLWCMWYKLNERMDEVMALYEKWGVKGIKVDFMDRDDQYMTNFYWRCAKKAAKYHLLVNFHGAHKPSGIQRTYPNVMNFEGVVGLEASKGHTNMATPKNAVTIPFIRMFAGPVDYTPGAMRNAQKKEFRAISHYPMSQGTRCQQLAMYVIYDAPLQMLADNPTIYEKNKESLHFISSVPTTWDKTIPLSGEVGEYVALARKNGKEYFVAAMTNWNARDMTLDFSFLPEGEWEMVIFRDGVNADRNGIDFKKIKRTINNTDKLKIHLAPGGGWVAKLHLL